MAVLFINGIVPGVIMAIIAILARQMNEAQSGLFDFGRGVPGDAWVSAILAGILVGAINYSAPAAKGIWTLVLFLVMIAMNVVLLKFWQHPEHGGCEWREFALFALMAFGIFMVSNTAAAAVVDAMGWTWYGVLMKIPLLFLIFDLGFMIASRYYYLASSRGGDRNDQ